MAQESSFQTELEAVQGGGGLKVALLLVGLFAAVIAAGWWFFGRPGGIGSAENPAKILVVRAPMAAGYERMLERGGFDASEGTLPAWERRAHKELGADFEGTSVAAVMTLADMFGYGYVVFVEPKAFDFSELDIEGELDFAPDVHFAVLSVGDFAFPHQLTVHAKPSPVLNSGKLLLLQALFAQARLAEALPDNLDPSLAAIGLRSQLSSALDSLAALPKAEKLAKKVVDQTRRLLVDDERADPKPRLLGAILESGSPTPLPGGGVLMITRAFTVVTSDGRSADLKREREHRYLFGAPTTAAQERTVCETLGGGTFEGRRSHTFSADGAAVLVGDSGELDLWVASAEAACIFNKRGRVRELPGYDGRFVPHSNGKVARSGESDGKATVVVVSAGTQEVVELGRVAGVTFGRPAWLDATHIAVRARGLVNAIFILSVAQPDVVLSIDGGLFGNESHLVAVAALGGSKRDVLVTVGRSPRRLYRITLSVDFSELFAKPGKIPGLGADVASLDQVATPDWEPPVAQRVFDLALNKIVARPLTQQGRVKSVVSSPDGTRVAFVLEDPTLDRADAADDGEIAVVNVATGKMRVLTLNGQRDSAPRFTADGQHVVFGTRIEIPKTDWVITAPRIADL